MLNIGNVFILGDSYSTFDGYIPEGYDPWYSSPQWEFTDVRTVDQTWWKLLLADTESNLLLNCSWSGTTICHTGYGGADCRGRSFVARVDRLIEEGYFETHHVDTFLVFGATNDSWADSPIGELQYSAWTEENLFCVLPAFCYLLNRLKIKTPGARVICVINTELKPEITDGMKVACGNYGVEFVQLQDIDKDFGHPNVRGMQKIKDQVMDYLLLSAKNE